MEEMDAEAMMESVVNVLNSNEDIPFDSTCRIDIGAIKHPLSLAPSASPWVFQMINP